MGEWGYRKRSEAKTLLKVCQMAFHYEFSCFARTEVRGNNGCKVRGIGAAEKEVFLYSA